MASVRELETGNWQAQVRRRGQKPVVRTFKTKLEASRWARLLESEMDRGELEPADQSVTAPEAGSRAFRPWPRRIHNGFSSWAMAEAGQRQRPHGVAAAGACGLSAR